MTLDELPESVLERILSEVWPDHWPESGTTNLGLVCRQFRWPWRRAILEHVELDAERSLALFAETLDDGTDAGAQVQHLAFSGALSHIEAAPTRR